MRIQPLLKGKKVLEHEYYSFGVRISIPRTGDNSYIDITEDNFDDICELINSCKTTEPQEEEDV